MNDIDLAVLTAIISLIFLGLCGLHGVDAVKNWVEV